MEEYTKNFLLEGEPLELTLQDWTIIPTDSVYRCDMWLTCVTYVYSVCYGNLSNIVFTDELILQNLFTRFTHLTDNNSFPRRNNKLLGWPLFLPSGPGLQNYALTCVLEHIYKSLKAYCLNSETSFLAFRFSQYYVTLLLANNSKHQNNGKMSFCIQL